LQKSAQVIENKRGDFAFWCNRGALEQAEQQLNDRRWEEEGTQKLLALRM
jgi:hypothetical protein